MEISIFFEISLALALVAVYALIRYVFGTRIYYRENRYVTIQECLIPLLLVALHITSAKVLGFSILSVLLVVIALISLALLYFTQRKQKTFSHRQYLHQLNSIFFLVCCVSYVGLHVYRFFA